MTYRHLDTLGERGNENLCIIDEWVRELPMKGWMVKEGARVLPIYPAEASIFMTETRPGLRLCSLLGTTKNMLVVSAEFRSAIENVCNNEIEFLPFTLYDHRNRVFSRDYCIVNPIGAVDCLDLVASGVKYSTEDPTRIRRVERHVLDRRKMKDIPQLFRIAGDASEIAVGQELWKEIQARKFTNINAQQLRLNDEA